MMALKGQLKTVKKAIEHLKKDIDKSGQERMIQSKLSVAEACLGIVDT